MRRGYSRSIPNNVIFNEDGIMECARIGRRAGNSLLDDIFYELELECLTRILPPEVSEIVLEDFKRQTLLKTLASYFRSLLESKKE